MVRQEADMPLCRRAECGGHAHGGAPACTACRDLLDGIIEGEWADFSSAVGHGRRR